MRKILISLLISITVIQNAKADEGFWLPYILGQSTYDDMVKKGLKLTKNQIWDINKSSLKDAIVNVNGGCSGTVIGKNGLIITAHHCVNDNVASVSTEGNDLLKDGFTATSQKDELPLDMQIYFLSEVREVTNQVTEAIENFTGSERQAKQRAIYAKLEKEISSATGLRARVYEFFKGTQYLVMIFQPFTDIRLVSVPPTNLAVFGGDIDNFEYPRYSGDFAIIRVYANKENKSAAYSPLNVPLTTNYAVKVSLNGVAENDFTMTMGYPATTKRLEFAEGIKLQVETNGPFLARLYEKEAKLIKNHIAKFPQDKNKLITQLQQVENVKKLNNGELNLLHKFKSYELKMIQQQEFMYSNNKKEYTDKLIEQVRETYEQWEPFAIHRLLLLNGFLSSSYFNAFLQTTNLQKALEKNDTVQVAKLIKSLTENREKLLKSFCPDYEKQFLGTLMNAYYNEVSYDQHLEGFFVKFSPIYGNPAFNKFGENLATQIALKSFYFNDKNWIEFIKNPLNETVTKDPVFSLFNDILTNYQKNIIPKYNSYLGEISQLGEKYVKAYAAFNKKELYADANRTMRLSYGQVKNLRPKSGYLIEYLCTSKGLLEKYDPNSPDFSLTPEVYNALKVQDFGQYLDKKFESLPITFITNNDISGGSSGSGMLDKNGNLIGVIFDSNAESLSGAYQFEKEYFRAISVDIRFVFWYLDKLKKDKYILPQITLAN